ncbi:hypothetical protein AN403_5702 [Pseudomonas fluorescens]|uniref:Transmembrane protein n=1 Tax=Pseudomonas fluorescens TaxID=294 RepID=A0A0P9BF08_PSEFL|nr:hypothetical protein AN403_5702 [Pseudomonas fluorescens]
MRILRLGSIILAKPRHLILQGVAALLHGVFLPLSSGQCALSSLQSLEPLLQQLLLGPLILLQLPGLGEQPLIVAVQSGQFVLLDDQSLLQLTYLQLHLLNLGLVTALFLLALLLAGLAIMLQGIAGVLMLFLQRKDLPVAIQQTCRLIEVGVMPR